MNIAIIAQNRKKELMVQFCIAYCGLLAKHNLCATATTGKMIIDATGLRIDCLLPGSTGGEQQIAARVSYNEIDLVLMFRDPMEKYQNDAQINDLLRSCAGRSGMARDQSQRQFLTEFFRETIDFPAVR